MRKQFTLHTLYHISKLKLQNPPFKEKGCFLWLAGVCALSCDFWEEKNNRVFCGVERDPSEVWFLVRFHVSL